MDRQSWPEFRTPIPADGNELAGLLLIHEHRLVKPSDLSRLDAAFFNTNGWIGVLLLLFWGFDIVVFQSGFGR